MINDFRSLIPRDDHIEDVVFRLNAHLYKISRQIKKAVTPFRQRSLEEIVFNKSGKIV